MSPRRWASSGIEPPPQNGSRTGGGLPPVERRISARASSRTVSFVLFSHWTSRSMIPKRRVRSSSTAFGVGKRSGSDDGSSTRLANRTARQAASGRRAHHRWIVQG